MDLVFGCLYHSPLTMQYRLITIPSHEALPHPAVSNELKQMQEDPPHFDAVDDQSEEGMARDLMEGLAMMMLGPSNQQLRGRPFCVVH